MFLKVIYLFIPCILCAVFLCLFIMFQKWIVKQSVLFCYIKYNKNRNKMECCIQCYQKWNILWTIEQKTTMNKLTKLSTSGSLESKVQVNKADTNNFTSNVEWKCCFWTVSRRVRPFREEMHITGKEQIRENARKVK